MCCAMHTVGHPPAPYTTAFSHGCDMPGHVPTVFEACWLVRTVCVTRMVLLSEIIFHSKREVVFPNADSLLATWLLGQRHAARVIQAFGPVTPVPMAISEWPQYPCSQCARALSLSLGSPSLSLSAPAASPPPRCLSAKLAAPSARMEGFAKAAAESMAVRCIARSTPSVALNLQLD